MGLWDCVIMVEIIIDCCEFHVFISGKKGPIYEVEWNPNSQEFCVVYGCIHILTLTYNNIIDYLSLCTLKAGYTSLSVCLAVILLYPVPC